MAIPLVERGRRREGRGGGRTRLGREEKERTLVTNCGGGEGRGYDISDIRGTHLGTTAEIFTLTVITVLHRNNIFYFFFETRKICYDALMQFFAVNIPFGGMMMNSGIIQCPRYSPSISKTISN